MRVTLAFNLRLDPHDESQAELLSPGDVDRLVGALCRLGHDVTAVEVSCSPDELVDRILSSKPDLVFNVAEGLSGTAREAYYPAVYELLRLPYTGGGPGLLHVDLDKRMTEKLMAVQGVRVPRGVLIRPNGPDVPEDLPLPAFIKPNFEGSSKGIGEHSLVHTRGQAEEVVRDLLPKYPEGLLAEEYIPGRELSIPILEAWPGGIVEIVEHGLEGTPGFLHYDVKHDGRKQSPVCPAPLSHRERQDILALTQRVLKVMAMPDLGRVDIRLHENGAPFFLEVNPLPSLRPRSSMMTAARYKGLDLRNVMDLVIRSAAERYGLSLAPRPRPPKRFRPTATRPTAREVGLTIGRLRPGPHNAITDVANVKVGHVTHVRDNVRVDGRRSCIRTGITAVVPESPHLFNNHLVAGGFILNGIGEMSGLIQAIEWGWLETPILLTNTMSVGAVHTGIIQYMIERYPDLGRKVDVIIPLIGETNDAFLNDVRLMTNSAKHAVKAIRNAQSGPVIQGSVGGGTGMLSFDFAGGIGTASRVLDPEDGGYTLGVLVQSNFGKMRNLTVEGAVVGRRLDSVYPLEGRRHHNAGSVIVIVATDAPLLSSQLCQLSKRAALGLGRVGSFAASTSGEIVFAFSTANRTSREAKERVRQLSLEFVSEEFANPLYEGVMEATEEAVLNSIFCSAGMTGRKGRYAPPLPVDMVLEVLSKGREAVPPPPVKEAARRARRPGRPRQRPSRTSSDQPFLAGPKSENEKP